MTPDFGRKDAPVIAKPEVSATILVNVHGSADAIELPRHLIRVGTLPSSKPKRASLDPGSEAGDNFLANIV